MDEDLPERDPAKVEALANAVREMATGMQAADIAGHSDLARDEFIPRRQLRRRGAQGDPRLAQTNIVEASIE
jgi:hypothetical protein